MKNSIFLSILFLLSSCSANYYLKRSQALERKAIQKGAIVKVDTVYVDRKVIIPESHTDTLVSWLNSTDTIYITKDRIVTKVKINPIENTVYVDSKCLTDTVIVRVPMEVVKRIETDRAPWTLWLLPVAIALIAYLTFKRR